MEPKRTAEYYWHALFEAGVALKAFNGLWETVSGIAALVVPQEVVLRAFYALTHGELLEDPHDRLIDIVAGFLMNIPHGTRTFIALYILAHGILNLFLAYNLYRQRLWAFPAAAAVIGLFLLYQFDRIYLYHSKTLIFLTLIDIVFLGLLLHEYKHQRERRKVLA